MLPPPVVFGVPVLVPTQPYAFVPILGFIGFLWMFSARGGSVRFLELLVFAACQLLVKVGGVVSDVVVALLGTALFVVSIPLGFFVFSRFTARLVLCGRHGRASGCT